tara:strand:- start:337 stop:510 length:174 start_codon:yes stop_codon:yes gene_type:complete
MRSIAETMSRARELMSKLESNGLEVTFKAKGGAKNLLQRLGLESDELTINLKIPKNE